MAKVWGAGSPRITGRVNPPQRSGRPVRPARAQCRYGNSWMEACRRSRARSSEIAPRERAGEGNGERRFGLAWVRRQPRTRIPNFDSGVSVLRRLEATTDGGVTSGRAAIPSVRIQSGRSPGAPESRASERFLGGGDSVQISPPIVRERGSFDRGWPGRGSQASPSQAAPRSDFAVCEVSMAAGAEEAQSVEAAVVARAVLLAEAAAVTAAAPGVAAVAEPKAVEEAAAARTRNFFVAVSSHRAPRIRSPFFCDYSKRRASMGSSAAALRAG